MTTSRLPTLDKGAADTAMLIAMTVRNEMENFHRKHLTDEQMAELNPIIRNAVATTLYAISKYRGSLTARKFLRFQERLLPSYWEEPVLTEDYLGLFRMVELAPMPTRRVRQSASMRRMMANRLAEVRALDSRSCQGQRLRPSPTGRQAQIGSRLPRLRHPNTNACADRDG